MKSFLAVLVCLALSPSLAPAAPMGPAPAPRNFELMKCWSAKFGTLWASFGHLMTSGSDQVTFFPTEIGVFAPDLTSHLLYPTLSEALKVDLSVHPGFVHLSFSVPDGAQTRVHLLQLLQYDRNIDNSYLGNWEVTEGERDDVDQAACTLD